MDVEDSYLRSWLPVYTRLPLLYKITSHELQRWRESDCSFRFAQKGRAAIETQACLHSSFLALLVRGVTSLRAWLFALGGCLPWA